MVKKNTTDSSHKNKLSSSSSPSDTGGTKSSSKKKSSLSADDKKHSAKTTPIKKDESAKTSSSVARSRKSSDKLKSASAATPQKEKSKKTATSTIKKSKEIETSEISVAHKKKKKEASTQPLAPTTKERASSPARKTSGVSLKKNLSAAIQELETKPSAVAKKSTPEKKKPSAISTAHPAAPSDGVKGDAHHPAVPTIVEEEKPSSAAVSTPKLEEKPAPAPTPVIKPQPKRIITVNEFDTYRDFAAKIGVSPVDVIKKALSLGNIATINQKIDRTLCELIASEYNCETKFVSLPKDMGKVTAEEALKSKTKGTVPRPPVVTVMGHVDHGKTTLLDAIRHSHLAEGEHGGITQHIGAYKVKTPKGFVAFLDTPGHEAFTALRARGSKVTDIVVLVVSAVDGVMPQTIEAINHARAAGVPIIVAINKIDIQGANPERIKSELNQYKLTPEEWGGDTLMVEISARNNINIDKLLEAIHLQSEILELKCDPSSPAVGAVVEAKLDPRRGPLVTLLVRNGTLKTGDVFVAGSTYGKVRAMFDENGNPIRVAEPSTPALVLGASELPSPGDNFYIVKNEREAREITDNIKSAIKSARYTAQTPAGGAVILPAALDESEKKEEKVLRLILKADVAGSLEALRDHIERIEHPEFKIQIVHSGVGPVTESDVNLAQTTGSVIICFNVKADASAQSLAERYKVDIRTYRIVYDLFQDIKKALEGLLEPKLEETVTGKAVVRKKFIITKVGAVAGSYVSEGKIQRGSKARLIRDGIIVYDGKIGSLRRVKEDVNSVDRGYECGITLENFQDIKENDIIETYTVQKVKRLL